MNSNNNAAKTNETSLSAEEKARQTEESRRVVLDMCEALNKHVIDGMEKYWHKDANWRGPAGAGLKKSLKAFQNGWQRPFLNAFPEKKGFTDVMLAEGPYVAYAGEVCSKHVGEFLGLAGDGEEKRLRYMDFWKVEDGKIVDNWVLLDFVDFFRQHGIDLLAGKGWDDRDENYKVSS